VKEDAAKFIGHVGYTCSVAILSPHARVAGCDRIGDFLQQCGGIAEPLIAAMLHYY
jgi:hypothetical protein